MLRKKDISKFYLIYIGWGRSQTRKCMGANYTAHKKVMGIFWESFLVSHLCLPGIWVNKLYRETLKGIKQTLFARAWSPQEFSCIELMVIWETYLLMLTKHQLTAMFSSMLIALQNIYSDTPAMKRNVNCGGCCSLSMVSMLWLFSRSVQI